MVRRQIQLLNLLNSNAHRSAADRRRVRLPSVGRTMGAMPAWSQCLRLLEKNAPPGKTLCCVCMSATCVRRSEMMASFLGICHRHEGSDMGVCGTCLIQGRTRMRLWGCPFCRSYDSLLRSLVTLRALVDLARHAYLQAIVESSYEFLENADRQMGEIHIAVDTMGEQSLAQTRYIRFDAVAESQMLWVHTDSDEAIWHDQTVRLMFCAWVCRALLASHEFGLFQSYVRAQKNRAKSWVCDDGVWVTFFQAEDEQQHFIFEVCENGCICMDPHDVYAMGGDCFVVGPTVGSDAAVFTATTGGG